MGAARIVIVLGLAVYAACAAHEAPTAPPVASTPTAPLTPPQPASPAGSTPAPPPASIPDPTASPAPSSATVPAPAPPHFAAWSDPEGVAALVSNCHAAEGQPPSDGEPDPLSCRLPFDQSCVYDPCFNKNQECRRSCSSTCTRCDAACVDTCDSCEHACRDDACRNHCATRTATCKQACLTSLDHCASGTCGEASVAACSKSEKARWRSHRCSCETISACTEPCLSGDGEVSACLDRCRARFPGCDIAYCITGDPNGP